MATIENKNFTNFQGVNLKGSISNKKGGVIRFVADNNGGSVSTGTWDATAAIVPISGSIVGSANGSVENPYFRISGAGLSLGTGYIHLNPAGSSNAGTISVGSTMLDSDRAWQLPNISGTFPISGTFSVDLPAITGSNYLSTLVTVSGLRIEDGFVVTPQSVTSAALLSARAPVVIVNAVPGNGNVTLVFANLWSTASIPTTGVFGYTAVR